MIKNQEKTNATVSTNWLLKNLENKNIVTLDCSWYTSNFGRDTFDEYKDIHIKNAHFFDIDEICDKKSNLPHMAPSTIIFEKKVRSLNINKNSSIVVYDSSGIYSSPRVWWLFKLFSHNKVYVLDGGLKKWLREKKPVSNKISKIKKGDFIGKKNESLKINYKKILNNLNNKNYIILDAREPKRFNGKIKEIRSNLTSGNIPNSQNLYWKKLINKNNTLKTKHELNKIFKKYKLNTKKKIVTTCGSGITACIISFALFYANNRLSEVYDGSWCEWGSKNN